MWHHGRPAPGHEAMRGLQLSEANMNHTIVNCSECNKEMKIKVAAGFKAQDRSMCKACSQGTPTQKLNLAKAQKQGKYREIDRAIKGRA